MTHRIEIGFKTAEMDGLGQRVKNRGFKDLDIRLDSVRTVDVYTIDKQLSLEQLSLLARELFADPITQIFSCDRPLAGDFHWLLEIGFKPGVTDNVGRTAVGAIEDILRVKFSAGESVYTSKKYLISAQDLSRADIDAVATNLLANELVQRWRVTNYATSRESKYLPIPKVRIPHEPRTVSIDLNIPDEELQELSTDRSLALNLEEMRSIRAYFSKSEAIADRQGVGLDNRPMDAELEALAQTWSEHCKHKIFKAKITYRDGSGKTMIIDSLFDTYIRSATERLQQEVDWVVSTLWDNSGVMKFNSEHLFAFKCETHNSPSNEEPYGGALTGIVGVYRDPMGTGQGGRLIYGTYGFCTGDPFYQGNLRPRLHPRRLLEGVRKGVEDGGNKHGVPTPYGITFFDDGYMGKPAIYVLAAALIPTEVNGEPGYLKKADPSDLIVMCGGLVGIDGIHGATESSLEAGEWISASHVQIGDPFTQKKMHDFLIEARDLGLYKCITDNGAGGLSSSVGEMAQYSNGFELHLDKVPLKYAGLDPWQILVSESQERMTLAVHPGTIESLRKLAMKHDVEISVLGSYTSSGKFHVVHKGKTVAYLDMDFIHHGVPQLVLDAEWSPPRRRGLSEPRTEEPRDHTLLLMQILARPNICSKEYIIRQFDHEVQGTSVIKPLVGKECDVHSDAVVVAPILGCEEGIAISAGINPKYGQIDTYHMTACAMDEAIRRVVAVGASPRQIALNDNFCWPSPLPGDTNPDAKYKLAQLVRANQALMDYSLAFRTPCISGKDSMTMDGIVADVEGREHRISAMPTIQFSAAAKVEHVGNCVTMDVKRPGDLVFVLGITRDELGGSEYYEMMGHVGLNVPHVDSKVALALYCAVAHAIEEGLIASAHGCYKGGLAVALAQTSFAGGLGLMVDLRKAPSDVQRADKILYSESASRFVVTVPPQEKERFEQLMAGQVCEQIGAVTGDHYLTVRGLKGEILIHVDIAGLKKAWQETFGR